MKRLLILCALLATLTVGMAQRVFKHPGALLTNTEIETMKRHIEAGEEPWASEWNAMVSAYGAANYTAAPNTEIGGSSGNRQRACRDAKAAYYNTIIWRIRGTEANARCAATILSAWGNKCTSAKEELFQFPCLDMCTSAEFLRNEDGTFYEGWAEADRTAFMAMVRYVFVPALRGQASNRLPSWSAPATAGLMAAGILLDDSTIYKEALDYVMSEGSTKSTSIYRAIRDGGQIWEMGRDNVHAMLCVGDLVQMAQMAWNQGDDLYAAGDNRILKGVDYWCRYNSGHADTSWAVVSSAENGAYRWFYISQHDNGFRLRPDGTNFEAVYHHYKEVLGMDEANYPYLSCFTKVARPERDYGTLLYAADIATSPVFTTKPTKPQNVVAEDYATYVKVSWQHPTTEDQRDYFVYRSTDGLTWTQVGGQEYNTCNYVYDSGIQDGVTYYYKVRLRNYAGMGEESDICQCTVGRKTSTMPDGWAVTSVSGKIDATATYSRAAHNAFQLKGGGREIYYGDDGCGFVYYTFTGDGTITARISSGSGYQEGLMMRKSLASGSVMAALKVGGKGGRYLEMWNRVNQNDGKPTMLLGSDYTHNGVWMRLERKGNVFMSYVSRDGKTWNQVASQTLAFGSGTYYAGIFVCNDKNTSGGQLFVNVDHISIVNGSQQPCAAPENLSATAVNSARSLLTWDKVDGATSYTVLRRKAGGRYAAIATVDSLMTYTDSLLMSRQTYDYAVISENWSGMSADTAKVSVTMPPLETPAAPQAVAAQNGLKSALVSWQYVDGAAWYSLLRSGTKDGGYVTVADSIDGTSYTDNGLEIDSTYYYKVVAVNAVGKAESETVAAIIYKNVKISSNISANANILSIDYGINLRGRARFMEMRVTGGVTYMVKGARMEVAKEADFSDAVAVGDIGQIGSNKLTGIPLIPTDTYYRYFRIVAKEGMELNKSNFAVTIYGDTVQLRRQVITLPISHINMTVGGDDIDLGASASSGLPCVYTSRNDGIATIVDGRVRAVAEGRAFITVSQPGNDEWGAASNRTVIVTVSQTTGISDVRVDHLEKRMESLTIFTIDGRKVGGMTARGIYIVKYDNGTTKKIIKR